MRHIFVINPVAGKGKHTEVLKNSIENYFDNKAEKFEIYITKSQDDCTRFVHEKCKENINSTIYACGGDGTLHDVINATIEFKHVVIGVIPCGSGNDFVKNFNGVENFLNIDSQVKGESESIDLTKAGDKFSVSVCNIGFDADVAFNMHKFKRLPLISGHMSYYLSVLYCLSKGLGKYLEIKIDDDKEIKGNFLLAVVANGSTYGGGYNCAPKASISDGMLDVCLINKIPRIKILNLISKYKKGLHLTDEKIKDICTYIKCKKVEIKSKTNINLCLDGEKAIYEIAKFEVSSGCINFNIPVGSKIIDMDSKLA